MNAVLDTWLAELAQVEADLTGYQADRAAIIQAIMAPVQAELQRVNADYQEKLEELEAARVDLRTKIEAQVLAEQASYKGGNWHVVYSKGAVTWDSKRLEGMMFLIPQLADCRKEGAPKVSWRALKV